MKKYNFAIVEVTLVCSKCSKAIFINGPVQRALCSSCQHEHTIPPNLWRTILSDIDWICKESPKGKGKKSEYTSPGGLDVNWLSGNLMPYCTSCKTDFPPLEENLRKDEWNITCETCNTDTPVQSPYNWVTDLMPRIGLIINADIDEPDGVPEIPAMEPVLFACPGCSGNLEIDGTDRLIKCKYCNSNLYLPDDLWLRFHPAKKVRRWAIGFEKK